MAHPFNRWNRGCEAIVTNHGLQRKRVDLKKIVFISREEQEMCRPADCPGHFAIVGM